jgi:phytoene synthase
LNSPREIIKKGSKSFALASLFLPESQRADVYTLYAWFRHCDDVIDSSSSQFEDLKNLKEQTFTPSSTSQFVELQKLMLEKKLSNYYFNEFFEGLKTDLENKGFETLSQLELYCYRVAGVVGLIMCPIIGVRHSQALSHACALGLGMQLTNICRDVQEDAQNGRIYLPREILKQKFSIEDLVHSPDQAYPTVLQLLELADFYYTQGNAGLKYLPFRVAIAIGCASHIYRQIGLKIRSLGPESLRQRVYVTGLEKMKCVGFGIVAALLSRFERIQPSPENFELPIYYKN